jgi:hypothetical protein
VCAPFDSFSSLSVHIGETAIHSLCRHCPLLPSFCLPSYLGQHSLLAAASSATALYTMNHENLVLSRSTSYLRSSWSLPSMHSTTSTTSSVEEVTKAAKSVTTALKIVVKKGATAAIRPLKKAQPFLSSRGSLVNVVGAFLLS